MLTSALILPPLILLLLCLAQAYRIYAHNRTADTYRFQAVAQPAPPCSLLIVSPHPDDETLGAGGLMQDAIRHGCPVHVVFVTNGDSFRIGASRYYKKIRVAPADYIRYGSMREGEARAALATLGLPAQDITFLGYPDQGLLPIWRQHWLISDAYVSPYSRASSVPYRDAASPGAPYCGQSIVADLVRQIEQDQPTDIYTTHPNDDHPDHETAAAYVDLAVVQVKAQGEPWSKNLAVHYFLVHRGDWPVPQGLDEDAPLAPPAPMIPLDTQWRSLPLSPATTQVKEEAILRYPSQQEVMGRFLVSFARRNELFGQIGDPMPDLAIVPAGSVRLDGSADDWPTAKPVALDPAGDTVLRDFQAGADLVRLWAVTDSHTLFLRADMRGPVSSDIHYVFNIRAFDLQGNSSDKSVTVTFSPRLAPAGQSVNLTDGESGSWSGHTVEASVPLTKLGSVHSGLLFIEARTKLSGLTIDHTGIRAVRLNLSPSSSAKPLS